jgi:hypothetical protein
MTSLVVAIEIGATHLSFAHTEHPEGGPPTVGRVPRRPRPVAPTWRSGPAVYVDPGPAAA